MIKLENSVGESGQQLFENENTPKKWMNIMMSHGMYLIFPTRPYFPKRKSQVLGRHGKVCPINQTLTS